MMRKPVLALLVMLSLPPSPLRAQADDPIVPGVNRKVSEVAKLLAESKSPKTRLKALLALESAGPRPKQVLPAICKALRKDEDADVRVAAAQVLERMRPAADDAHVELKDTVECLRDALVEDKNERVREAVATTLGRMGVEAKAAVPALAAALKDASPGVQKAAADSIDHLGDDAARALSNMMDLLKDPKADVLARCSAASFVGRIADVDVSVPALSEVLKGDSPVRLRRTALEMLGRAGAAAEPAVPLLTKALTDKDNEVRIAAATALAHVGPAAKAALPALREALKDGEKYVRTQALEALGKLGADAAVAVPDVLACLRNEKVIDVRVAGIKALGEMGPAAKEALGVLADYARTNQPTIRDAAVEAMNKIRGS